MQAKPQALLTYPSNEQAKQAYQEFIAKHYQGFPEYQADEATQAWLLQEFEQAKQAEQAELAYQAKLAWAIEQAEQAKLELAKPLFSFWEKASFAFIVAWACYSSWLAWSLW